MTSKSSSSTPQVAVWCFIGATFLFIAPTLLFRDAPWWVTIVCVVLGLVATVGGGIQLGREIRQRRDSGDAPPDGGNAG